MNDLPPPAYSASANEVNQRTAMQPTYGNRPTNLWKISIPSQWDLYPFSALTHLQWCLQREAEVDYEFSFTPIPGWNSATFGCYRGKAGFSNPAFTYSPKTGTLTSTESDLSIKCSYDVSKRKNNQSLSFKFQGHKYKWISDSIMSTTKGHMVDLTKSFLINEKDAQLASFSWLLPDGNLDACIRPASDLIQAISFEILIMTFTIFYYNSFETMRDENKSLHKRDRITTLERVRATLTPGRMILYGIASVDQLDNDINELRQDCELERQALDEYNRRPGESFAGGLAV